jgi:hypothetical protein
MWFHQSEGLEKFCRPLLPHAPSLSSYISSLVFYFTKSTLPFLFLLIFLHSLLSHLSHSPCRTGSDWTSGAQAGGRQRGGLEWRPGGTVWWFCELVMIFVLILWKTCDIEVILLIHDCDLCDDSCKYTIVNRVIIFVRWINWILL